MAALLVGEWSGMMKVGLSWYFIFFGEGSSNKAELLALVEGLRLCQEFEFERVSIEGDSAIVIRVIQ